MSRDDLEHGWIVDYREETEGTVACICAWCGADIYEGEGCYDFSGEKVCCDCIDGCKTTA